MSEDVAIIGAGPAGLSAARYLKSQGFRPILFEQHDDLGGQWNHANPASGVWPSMCTNTARFVTKLSDMRYPGKTPLFPHNQAVLDMLRAFSDERGLAYQAHFGARVTGLARADAAWRLDWQEGGKGFSAEFARVVVATGRFNSPWAPDIPGLERFCGAEGIRHSFDYDGAGRYRGLRVLVAGGATSALEIASDICMSGAARVHVAQRQQRYVLQKVMAGVPLEYIALTRRAARKLMTASPAEARADRRRMIKALCGDPVSYGAPAPVPDIDTAGVTGCPYYLSLVAEGRIDIHPWIERVDGRRVLFTDGSDVEVDGILLATGFRLSLPFLSDEIARCVSLTDNDLSLTNFTFHPQLPGVAFLGLWPHFGPYFVALEQQARYLAHVWGGLVAAPAADERPMPCAPAPLPGGMHQSHEMTLTFARLAGVEPEDVGDAELSRIIDLSALTGEMFRIRGPEALSDAAELLQADFDRFAPEHAKSEVRSVRRSHARREVG